MSGGFRGGGGRSILEDALLNERVGYHGPMPPPGKPHRYFFKLYALDAVLNLPPKAAKGQVAAAMKGRILGEAQLIGIYER